jgi:lysyl-tRNA synthetase class 2
VAPHRHPHRRVRRTGQALIPPLQLLHARARILEGIRVFFRDRGLLEVETPVRVICPGLEPHLVAIPAGDRRWLRTSPELHLKKLLASGSGPIFELARCFRADESGPWHRTEFTLLEWYRPDADLTAIEADVIALLPHLASVANADPTNIRGCDLSAPPLALTVREAVHRHTGLDLAALRDAAAFAAALRALELNVSADDDWDALFFRLMITRVEPHLGRDRITLLREYPASQAALANIRPDPDWPVALRTEVYLSGIELANAFDELTDPVEQRRRHEADRALRRSLGREVPDLDEEFLAALDAGMPRCAGIALGIDRLIALLLGLDDVRQVTW